MISITEIVLIVAGFAAIILGYLLPAGRELDEEDKVLMEKEIRELVKREVEEQKDTIEDMVGDSVENSLDRTERAMERISNEKMSAIGEYSDTVINDIHKNHDEVMFMYDMLNDKHKNLTSVVSEVTKKTDEARQAVRDAEATAKEALSASNSLKNTEPSSVRAILLDENEEKLSGIRIPVKEKTELPPRDDFGQVMRNEAASASDKQPPKPVTPKPVPKPKAPEPEKTVQSGYVEEKHIKELEGFEQMPVSEIKEDQVSSLHVIGNTPAREETSSKVVPITEAVRVEPKAANPDRSMKELTASDPVTQNKQIIEMHKQGKSNMVIARELGLGIGEVKLVIDLSNKHRKVR
jgi:hypothetical protein